MPEETNYFYKSIENFYDRVRSCLNVKQSAFPDEEIDFPENAPTAERKMKLRVSDWEALEGESLELFKTCIVYMTCYALCPLSQARKVSQQSTPNLTLKYSDTSSTSMNCDYFLSLVDGLVSEITGEKMKPFFGFEVTTKSGQRFSTFPS